MVSCWMDQVHRGEGKGGASVGQSQRRIGGARSGRGGAGAPEGDGGGDHPAGVGEGRGSQERRFVGA